MLRTDLAVLSTASTEDRLQRYRDTGDRAIRNRVVEDHRWLAVVVAKGYWTGGEPLDDLIQVACVGILRAAERFDPSFGVAFRTFATITARGELRRYYRDSTWALKVPRRLQELRYELRAAAELLEGRLLRSPTTEELAEYLHVSTDEVIDCLCADRNFRALSTDVEDDASGAGQRALALIERGFGQVDSDDAFEQLLSRLPPQLRRVAELRFISQMKQADIGAELGISQVHVSRLLHQAVDRVRRLVEHHEGDVSELGARHASLEST